jgi:hypothetical protein
MAREMTEIRHDIDETRERLRDTAEALGWKVDLPARARDVMRETAAVVRERLHDPERRRRGGGGREDESGVGARLSAAKDTLEETAGALKRGAATGAKAVSEGAGSARDAISERSTAAGRAIERGQSDAAGLLPESADLRRRSEAGLQAARSNPIPIAMGALALGALAGVLLPSTRAEDERIGPMADDLKHEGLDAGGDAVPGGREAAETVIRG